MSIVNVIIVLAPSKSYPKCFERAIPKSSTRGGMNEGALFGTKMRGIVCGLVQDIYGQGEVR